MTETLEQMEIRHAAERAELVQKILKRAYKDGVEDRIPKGGPRLDAITIAVSKKHGVDLADIRSHCRKKKFAYARFEAWSKARKAGFSLQAIGDYWKRDHTTVLAGVRRYYEIAATKTVGVDQ